MVRECLIIPTHCSWNKDKKSAGSSPLTALVIKARTQCWLNLKSPRGLRGEGVGQGCTATATSIKKGPREIGIIFK